MNILGQPCLKQLQRLALLKLYYANGDNLSAEIERSAESSWAIGECVASFEKELNELGKSYVFETKFAEVCAKYDVIFVQNWYRLYPDDIDPNEAFLEACSNGRLTTAQWIAKSFSDEIVDYDGPLGWACGGGHLNVAQWLVETFSDYIEEYNEVFRGACAAGRLNIAQWLVETFPNNIENYDDALGWACLGGHLNVAQWLVETFPDHIKNYDRALRDARTRGHLNIVQWLEEIRRHLHPKTL